MDIYSAFSMVGIHYDPLPYPNQVRCPNHEDKHPSCRIYPDSDNAFCFSCKQLFTPVTVLAEHGGYGYKKAYELVGDVIKYNAPSKNFDSLFAFAVTQIGYNETLDHYLNLSIINENVYDDLVAYVNSELGLSI